MSKLAIKGIYEKYNRSKKQDKSTNLYDDKS